jgi:hypothetical protein
VQRSKILAQRVRERRLQQHGWNIGSRSSASSRAMSLRRFAPLIDERRWGFRP